MNPDVDQVEAALGPVRQLVEADGFALRLDGLADGELRVSVLAGDDVCGDCLVPKPVMQTHILRALANANLRGVRAIRIRYPDDD